MKALRKEAASPITVLQQGRCFLCGTAGAEVVLKEGAHVARQCSCGVVYADPVPDAADVDLTVDHHHRIYYSAPAAERLRWVRRAKPAGRLLDLGCGEGEFAELAVARGYEAEGMEPDERRADVARRRTGIRVEPAFLEQDTLPPNSFDVVFHIDLLSHFIDPVKSLKSMRRLLREDGVICFEVGLFSKLSPFWHKFAGRANMPDHRWFYDERALQATLERSGLEIVEIRKFDIGASTFLTTALLQVLRPSALGKDGGSISRPMASGTAGRCYYRLQMWLRYSAGKWLRTGGPKAAFVTARPVG